MGFSKPKVDLTPPWSESPLKKTKKPLSSKVRKYKNWKAAKQYKRRVGKLTELSAVMLPGIEKRGFKSYHIDHKISIWYGFKHGISADKIAHISNLRMIHHQENTDKGKNCFIDEHNSWIIADNAKI